MNIHRRKINAILDVDPYVWMGGDDGLITVWNRDTCEVKAFFEMPFLSLHLSLSLPLSIPSAGGSTCSGILSSFSHILFQLIRKLDSHGGKVKALAVHGGYVWSCAWDMSIKLYNAQVSR